MLNSKSTSKEKVKSRLSHIARELVSAKKLILYFLAFTGSINYTYAQWQRTNGPNGAGQINCIAVSGTNIFAGTSSGGVFLSTDTGTTWTAVNNGLTGNGGGILSLAVSGTNILAGTNYGLFLSTNNGTSWTAVNNGIAGIAIKALAVSGTNILAGTFGNGVFLSADNGSSWTAINGFPGYYICSMIVSGTNILAGTLGGYLGLSTNGGATWMEIDNGGFSGPVNCIAVNGINIFVGTYLGAFLSNNNGASWTAVNNGLLNTNVISLAINGTTILAGTSGGVFMSKDTGSTWTGFNSGLTDSTIYSFALSGKTIFAGTDTSGVWKRQRSDISCSPYISASSATAFFCGGTVTLSASTGSSYLWSDNETTQSIVVSSAGNYSCNVTTNCGSLPSNIISVIISGVTISASGGAPVIICGSSVTLTAVNGNAYLWSDQETTRSIMVTTAANYSCAVTTNCGTVTSNTINVTFGSNSISSSQGIGQVVFCQGDSVTLTAISTNGYWSDGETTQSIVVKTPGSYYNIIDCNQNHQELASNIIQVYTNPSPHVTITPGGSTLCQGQGAILTVSNDTSYYNSNITSILWSNGATTINITVLTPQTDSVTITDASGCSATSVTTITAIYSLPAAPVINAIGATTFCEGDSVELTSSAANSYNWDNGATTQNITVKSSGNYSVIAINANGCSSSPSNSISVIIHSNPIPPIINQSNDSLKSSVATGIQWYLNGAIIPGATGQFYIATQSGIYTVKDTNSNGCSSSASLNFTLVGIAELTSDYSFLIYPNPAGKELRIKNDPESIGIRIKEIDIYNILGAKIYSQQSEISIDVSALLSGIYFVQVSGEKERWSGKFVKE